MVVLALLLALGGLTGGTLLQIKSANDADAVQFRAANGMTAEGRIVTSEPRKGKSDARMTYEFQVSGVTWSGTLRQGELQPVGTTLTIGYLPLEPADNWAVGHEPQAMQTERCSRNRIRCPNDNGASSLLETRRDASLQEIRWPNALRIIEGLGGTESILVAFTLTPFCRQTSFARGIGAAPFGPDTG